MRRRGIVKTCANGKNQCKSSGHDTYGYEIRIICHESNKDSRGFIIDNMIIQELVNNIFQSKTAAESCETVVCCLGKAVEKAAKANGVLYNDVYVHVWPLQGNNPVDPDKSATFEYSSSGIFHD